MARDINDGRCSGAVPFHVRLALAVAAAALTGRCRCRYGGLGAVKSGRGGMKEVKDILPLQWKPS